MDWQRQNDKSIALNYQEYVSELEADRTYADQFDAVKYNNNLEFRLLLQARKDYGDSIFREKELVYRLDNRLLCRRSVNILDNLKVGIYARTPCEKINKIRLRNNQPSVFI